jgi:hypothetical protein
LLAAAPRIDNATVINGESTFFIFFNFCNEMSVS